MGMIKVGAMTPDVYSEKSRDFQLLGCVYDALFNSVKMGVDMVKKNGFTKEIDERLLDLASETAGFIEYHEYDSKDLKMVLSSFTSLLRNKGSLKAIRMALNIILRSQGIPYNYLVTVNPSSKHIDVYIDSEFKDVVLLKDLFKYILPFGFTYRMYKTTVLDELIERVIYVDDAEAEELRDLMIKATTSKTVIHKVGNNTAEEE